MPAAPDVAIVVTVHSEGRMLVPTLRALARTVENASPLTVEVIIVRDRADAATIDAVDRALAADMLSGAAELRVIDVNNGDLSASRNDGTALTKAAYVGVLDADNLPSLTWIADGYKALQSRGSPAVVHPELIVTFGAKREVWPLLPTTSPEFRPGWLAWYNTWDAFVIADRSVFEQFPWRPAPPGGGFGPEDWAWNCDTVAAGIPHLTAPGTTLFYRATDHGLAAAHHGSLLPRNDLLRSQEVAGQALAQLEPTAEPAEPTLRERNRALDLGWRAAAYATRPVRNRLRKPEAPAAISTQLLSRQNEWAAVHELQPALPYPSVDTLRGYGEWGTGWAHSFVPEQRAYWSAIAELPPQIDALFIAPWLRTGGADLLTMQYIASVQRSRPDAKIAIITTEAEPSTRLGELDGVSVFELGAFNLLPQFGVRVLGTLIAQLRPGTVHVVNSTLGYDVLDRYGYPLRAHSNLFVSTYVVDQLPDGTHWTFLHHRSPDFYNKISAVLTDNVKIGARLASAEGAPLEAFVVHRAVADDVFRERTSPKRPLRVVWAGRFDRQKRLDRLVPIARMLQDADVEFDVYGDEVIADDPGLPATREQLLAAGVRLHPAYTEGLPKVVSADDVLILTPDREGLPNVMLAAMASGVPVIAPDVGDIGSVISDATGYLISDPSDIEAYAAAVLDIIARPDEAARRAKNARKLIEDEFSAQALDATLAAIPGYLPRVGGTKAPAFSWFTDHNTAELLRGGDPLTLVYTGSNGHSNFGDILQNKNILQYWLKRPDRTPVLFLPAFAAVPEARIAELRRWFRCPNIVFFAPERAVAPVGLTRLDPISTQAPVHVVGGGYLNKMWGGAHFAAIDAIATDFAASEIFFTGLQVDKESLAGFTALAENHNVPFIGLRDAASFELVRAELLIPAINTFDDLTEVLTEWAGTAEPAAAAPGLRVAVHMNTSEYAGGAHALKRWRDALSQVAALQPDEVFLVSAYSDERTEVQDTLRSMAALAEEFPFARVTVLDSARASLDWVPGEGLPAELKPLRTVNFGLSSSYHTALMMTFLGVPTYLMGANAYFSQKAQLFQLPPIEQFLADPDAYRVDVSAEVATRQAWIEELNARG